MLTGRIVKGVAGVYDVAAPGAGRFSCPARGLFRKSGASPVPGDIVTISNIDWDKRTGYLHEIMPRSNELIRPKAANITQALLVFSAKSPDLNTLLVDTMLAYMESLGISPVICINKLDLCEPESFGDIERLYAPAGYKTLPLCAVKRQGLESVMEVLPGHVTILTGPSGAGKSSLINALFPELRRETGELSRKIARGKNTTRSCELFEIGPDSFIADTPGFTCFDAIDLPPERLQYCFPEFAPSLGSCYYGDCLHVSEHDCAVKERVGSGIPAGRYENYVTLVSKANL